MQTRPFALRNFHTPDRRSVSLIISLNDTASEGFIAPSKLNNVTTILEIFLSVSYAFAIRFPLFPWVANTGVRRIILVTVLRTDATA